MDVQVRSEETGIQNFPTVKEAFEYAGTDLSVWKISFDVEGERVRLVRFVNGWLYEPLM